MRVNSLDGAVVVPELVIISGGMFKIILGQSCEVSTSLNSSETIADLYPSLDGKFT